MELDPKSKYYGWIFVHIADPAAEISPEGALEDLISSRATSVYLPLRTYHMLPLFLTSRFSIEPKPKARVRVVTVAMRFGADGELLQREIFPSVADSSSVRKIPYPSLDSIFGLLDGGQPGKAPLSDSDLSALEILRRTAIVRSRYRAARSSRTLELPTCKVVVHPRNRIQLVPELRTESKDMVAEFMVAAGEAFGAYARLHDLRLPYRCQPSPEPLTEQPPPLARGDVSESDRQLLHTLAILPSQRQAEYVAAPAPHHSMGLDAYVHCTSPIRRYADILAHRAVLAHAAGAPAEIPNVGPAAIAPPASTLTIDSFLPQ